MINIGHCGRRSGLEVVQASEAPVFNTHIGCKAVYADRGGWNADDDYLVAIAKKGGVLGLELDTLAPERGSAYSFNAWFPHLEHAIKIAGIDHVGIATDWIFIPGTPPHPMDFTNWPYFAVGLVCRGLSDEEIRKVIGGNFLRLAEQVLNKQPWGPFISRGHSLVPPLI
jgi:membrane dipeptidase